MPMPELFDEASFVSYCSKYVVPFKLQEDILSALREQTPELKQFSPEYEWEKEGKWGYECTAGKTQVKIELGNYASHNMMNVTFIGIEGLNM